MKKKRFYTILSIGVIILAAASTILGIMAEQGILSLAVLLIVEPAALIVLMLMILKYYRETCNWYDQLLDHMPQPISVTDAKMNWTFVNKPVEDMLKLKREKVLGQHCSNWGAKICNTENCGVHCLKNNKPQTFFDQLGMNFKVDTSYLYNLRGKEIGHIEVVAEITEKVQLDELKERLSTDVNALVDSLTTGSSKLAASSEEVSASIEEISASLDMNSENSSNTEQKANTVASEAEISGTALEQSIQAVNEIVEKNSIIQEIARQTNLLALNAAIEAARAGEAGKGFAVVAGEVKKLAERSQVAANEIEELIKSTKKVTSNAGDSIRSLIPNVKETAQLVQEINRTTQEQRVSMQQIAEAIQSVSNFAMESNSISEQLQASFSELENFGEQKLLE